MTGQLPLFDDPPAPPPPAAEAPAPLPEQCLEPIPLDKDHAATPAELAPAGAQFMLTKNYNLAGSFIGRLLRALDEQSRAGRALGHDALAAKLTIPTQRVDSLFAFTRKSELVTVKNQLTPLGTLILIHDPYLLNPGLLWFLHALMASNARLVIWSRLFDSIAYQQDEITPVDTLGYFKDFQGNMTEAVYQKNTRNEVGALLRSYVDDLFRPLGLVQRISTGRYIMITDDFDIPALVWLASILAYRERYYSSAASLETHLLVDAHFSPGRLFRQNEAAVRRALDGLHNAGLLTVESHLGLDQVRFKSGLGWLGALARHLQGEGVK